MNIFAGLHKLKFGFISSDDKCKSMIVFQFLTNAAPHFLKKLTPLPAFAGLVDFSMSRFKCASTPELYDTKSSYQLNVSITKCEIRKPTCLFSFASSGETAIKGTYFSAPA